jgi:hypothetical protein
MRPSILFPLFAEIRTLSGVGPKLEKLIQKVAGPRLVDLVFDLPVGVGPFLPAQTGGRRAGADRHRGGDRAGAQTGPGEIPAI